MFPEYDSCKLCPRECGANRNGGKRGFCGETGELRIAAIGPHFGEEPCLAGRHGSGTVFFSGCQTGCFFCQNYQISSEHLGRIRTDEDVVDELAGMIDSGVHNVNFVTPEPWWPHIRNICQMLRARGYDAPFVWNSSGYFKAELLAEQAELIDVFLPDFKFSDPELAKLCMGRADYPECAMAGLKALVDRVGFLRPFDETGEMTATRGVMVRHLVLPGYVENSLKALEMLFEEFGDGMPVSIMRQYQPMPECFRRNLLTRTVTDEEYQRVCDKVDELGFRRVFVQTGELNDDFLPDFTKDSPFKGNQNRK